MSATTQPTSAPTAPPSEPPAVIPPSPAVFSERAARFEELAADHPLGDWLRFLAALSRAQQEALRGLPGVALPDATALAAARTHRMPPLPAQSWPRDPEWRAVLRRIAATLRESATDRARGDLDRLAALPAAGLEALAERVLHTELYGEDAALLPYVAAALQVLWTGAAMRVGAELAPLDVPSVCPCCGFLPVASVVKTVGTVGNLRYLHCALCNTEWNLVRVRCAACDAMDRIRYRLLEGEGVGNPGAVAAETCDSCRSYLKIVYREKGGVDPVADDLATLALDILVDEAGYARAGPNLLFVPGDG